MDLLGTILAFAVTMLAMSIVVTASVETLHRLIGLREKGLRVMLGHFYDAEVAAYVARTPLASPETRDEFLDRMTRNRAPAGEMKMPLGRLDGGFLSWIWGGQKLGSLSLEDFMGRLGSSPTGDAIAAIGSDLGAEAVDTVVRDLAHKFDEFGREASEYFSARARLLSVGVALVIAWQCYVNPYDLFAKFLVSPTLAQEVAALAPQVLELAQEEQKRAETTPAAAGEEAAGTTVAEDDAKAAAADLQRTRQARRATLEAFSSLGVPIGWTPERLQAAGFARSELLGVAYPKLDRKTLPQAIATIAWLVLGGLLVGLGAPFWREIVLSLTNLRGGAAKPQPTVTEQGAADGRINGAVTRFLVASEAQAVATGDIAADVDVDAAVG